MRTSQSKNGGGRVRTGDLLEAIKSTRNVNELKKKLVPQSDKRGSDDPQTATSASKLKDAGGGGRRRKKGAPLDVPLHRQAARRIESEIAYAESRKELHKWNEVVFTQRVAEQIRFPLGEERSTKVESAADKAKGFQPTTELERQTAEVLGGSKYNLRNKEAYCEAELEIIRAMNLREAKRRCAELQNRRALMSYKAAKLRHDSKIKSKGYHRRLRRAQRRQEIKDIEKLVEGDPDLAQEKLQQLDEERAVERATLKHSGTSNWSRHVKQYASKDPQLRRLIDEQLRKGRELRSRRDDETDALEELWDRVETGKARHDEGGEGGNELNFDVDEGGSMLKLPTREILRVPDELMDEKAYQVDNEELQLQFLADAYEDDDVVEEFRARKRRVEGEEEPTTKDCNLYGWGRWTGPGIVDKKDQGLIVKPQMPERKDASREGIIIREKVSEGVAKLQPRDVPFPFTNVRDYETSIRQPLGRDWNTPLMQASLVQPKVVTKQGRIIRPIDKKEKLKMKRTTAGEEDDGDSLDSD